MGRWQCKPSSRARKRTERSLWVLGKAASTRRCKNKARVQPCDDGVPQTHTTSRLQTAAAAHISLGLEAASCSTIV